MVIIEARPSRGRPPFTYEVLHQEAVRNDPGFSGRVKSSRMIVAKILESNVDLVALEECAPIGGFNTTGLQQSAFLEMIMFQLYEAGVPMMVTPPATMRSFVSAKTGKASKKSIMDNLDSRYGFRAQHARQKERSDISDAFAHAALAVMVLLSQEGKLTSSLIESEKRVLFGDTKGKMVGVLDRRHMFHRKAD